MISVLMNIYYKENPLHLDLALQSLYEQTFRDFELVLVIDGPAPAELNQVVESWMRCFGDRAKCIRLKTNVGIARAINAGLKECTHDLIAKMDSDDYSLPTRLEKQVRFMQEHPEIDVLGSQMGEFESVPQRIHMIRKVPLTHDEIIRLMWFMCPMNHVTVMYRKKSLLSVGGYDPTYGNDDFLWAKMRLAGCQFHNLDECLVHARVGNNMGEMIRRRSTWELFIWNCKIRTFLFRHKLVSFWQYVLSMVIAVGIYSLPLGIKCYLFRKTRQVLPFSGSNDQGNKISGKVRAPEGLSVAMNVYHRENPAHLDVAFGSLYDQTFQNFEIVLAVDGPIPPTLHAVIDRWKEKLGSRLCCVYLEKNGGIAVSLNATIQACSYDLIARMDSDDYSLPTRLEKQYRFMQQHPEVDVLGTQMGEFESDPLKIHMIRKVPLEHEPIWRAMWLKTPMNHVTVMYRKKAIMAVGGYDPMYGNDDFLWAKMIRDGFRFHNLDDCLVHARVGENMRDMIKRRATLELFRWNCKMRTYLFKHRIISLWQYFLGLVVATGIFLLPVGVKCYLFKKTRVQVI